MLPPEAIEEFRQLYQRVFGEELNEADALERATQLLELYRAVYEAPSME